MSHCVNKVLAGLQIAVCYGTVNGKKQTPAPVVCGRCNTHKLLTKNLPKFVSKRINTSGYPGAMKPFQRDNIGTVYGSAAGPTFLDFKWINGMSPS